MKEVIWMNYGHGYDYDREWAKESGITKEDLDDLGGCCLSWFYAEMSDSYSVTCREQDSLRKYVKPFTDKYNLTYHGTNFKA